MSRKPYEEIIEHFGTMPDDASKDIILRMIDKASVVSISSDPSRDTLQFNYIKTISTFIAVIMSNAVKIDTILYKISISIAIIIFSSLAIYAVLLKHIQSKNLSIVLVHLENLIGCYKRGLYYPEATLLPVNWMKTKNYIGHRIFLPYVITILSLMLLCLFIIAIR